MINDVKVFLACGGSRFCPFHNSTSNPKKSSGGSKLKKTENVFSIKSSCHITNYFSSPADFHGVIYQKKISIVPVPVAL